MFVAASSQFATFSERLGRVANRFQPYQTAPITTYVITGGLLDQCTGRCQLDAITIGAEAGCDIVLVDPTVASRHVQVKVAHSMLGPLAMVTASGGAICVNESTVPKGGMTKYLPLPLKLQFENGPTVEIATASKSQNRPRSIMERLIRRLTMASAVLLVAAVGFFSWDYNNGRSLGVRILEVDMSTSARVGRSETGLEDLKNKLAEVGLQSSVIARENGDGMIEVSGRLTQAQWSAWQGVAEWYDGVSFGRPMVSSLVVGARFSELPPISMVELTEPKRIILATGEMLLINDVFSGDWRISAIEEDYIMVSRGDESEIFKFAEPAQ